MNRSICRLIRALAVLAVAVCVHLAAAQDKSVRPGINKPFENPDVPDFIGKFETESREIFTQRKEVVAACKLKEGMAVADVGAGTGLFTRLFAKQVGAKGKVYAVDIAPRFVEHIKKTCKEADIKNVVGVVCTADSTRLPAGSVDVVFICDTYHHFEFPFKTMASIHEALRPGGRVIVIDFHRIKGKSRDWVLNHVRAGQEVIVKEIESSGFKKVDEKKLLKENYFVEFKKVERKKEPQSSRNWPDLLQKPYEQLPAQDPGLKPLLRRADGQKIESKRAWEEQRQRLRAAWLKRLGKPPAKPASLSFRIESREIEPDCIRTLVSFVSEGDDRIRAYLLSPKGLPGGEPRPAIVVFHPTTKETLREPVGLGKRQDMALALQLVRRGYIALSPECFIMKNGGARAQAEALARRIPDWTGLGKMTFDASRCVDYLETLAEVDRSRIACIGHSLGAKEVLYAMAFEPRYQVGVFNEGGIGLRMSNWTDPWYLTEAMKEHIPEMEHHQILALIAPRPILILGGDSADGAKSWPFVKEVREVYALLGAGERIGLYNHKAGHAFPEPARELAYQWLDHWLKFRPHSQ